MSVQIICNVAPAVCRVGVEILKLPSTFQVSPIGLARGQQIEGMNGNKSIFGVFSKFSC